MVGLVDIAPAVATVTVREQEVPVYGVSVHGIANLLGRFPELRMLMTGKSVDAERLIELGPDAVVAIIAAGTGAPGDEPTEEAARREAIEVQADFLEAILKVTLPGGLGPLVERLQRLGVLLKVEEDAAPAATPSGKKPASKSPKRSKR